MIIKSLNNLESNGKVLNVASGKAIKVKKVILDIKNIINKGNPEFGKIKMRKDEINKISANIKLTKKIFDWKAKIVLRDGIKKTINYFKKKKKKQNNLVSVIINCHNGEKFMKDVLIVF